MLIRSGAEVVVSVTNKKMVTFCWYNDKGGAVDGADAGAGVDSAGALRLHCTIDGTLFGDTKREIGEGC